MYIELKPFIYKDLSVIKKTNLFRTAALSVVMLMTPSVTLSIQTVDDITLNDVAAPAAFTSSIEGLTSAFDYEEALTELDAASQKIFAKLCASWLNLRDADAQTCQAALEQLPAWQEKIDALSSCVQVAKASGSHPEKIAQCEKWIRAAQDNINWCNSTIASTLRWQHIRNSTTALVTGVTYSNAWKTLKNTEGIQEKATALWNDHKLAVFGVATVAAVTTAAITACYVYRNKIKAGWNRLFGSKNTEENTQDTEL
jgi:hypothetical protein